MHTASAQHVEGLLGLTLEIIHPGEKRTEKKTFDNTFNSWTDVTSSQCQNYERQILLVLNTGIMIDRDYTMVNGKILLVLNAGIVLDRDYTADLFSPSFFFCESSSLR